MNYPYKDKITKTDVIKMNYKPKITRDDVIRHLERKILSERTSVTKKAEERKIRIEVLQELQEYFEENYL